MARTLKTTPRADGFRMPGEFEPHAGCWMLFPERPDVWREHGQPAQEVFVTVAEMIARFEPVTVGVRPELYTRARSMFPAHIRVVEVSYNDAWVRDCGPTFVVNDAGEIRGVDWIFNAWGGHYPHFEQDDMVAQKILELERCDRYRADFVVEGGAIHVDGQGTLLAVKPTILNPNRNPHLNQAAIEDRFKDYLNVDKIIWFDEGVYNDETNGHVDNLVCFVRPGVVALTWTDDPADPQYAISRAAYDILANNTDAQGRPFEIHPIQQPAPMYMQGTESASIEHGEAILPRHEGNRLAASYVNFYIANGGVIAPLFDDPQDAIALAKLAELFPDREVVGVPSREILLGGGNIHCITQQQPRAR